jgi:hypothetical protein
MGPIWARACVSDAYKPRRPYSGAKTHHAFRHGFGRRLLSRLLSVQGGIVHRELRLALPLEADSADRVNVILEGVERVALRASPEVGHQVSRSASSTLMS